jgi:hypothetical protein
MGIEGNSVKVIVCCLSPPLPPLPINLSPYIAHVMDINFNWTSQSIASIMLHILKQRQVEG